MSKLLFRLRDVPDDEAQEVREMLTENNIDFFETFPGNWGISSPALWLKQVDQYGAARELLDEYQTERRERIREEFAIGRASGEVKTFWQSFTESPFKFTAYILMVLVVLYLSTEFFLSF